jgi:hypothetical protein
MKIRAIGATLFLVTLCATVVVTQPHIASAVTDYYLTSATVPPTKALTACASGFHMASLTELSNFGTLHYYYNYSHAVNLGIAVQGHGPPLAIPGWIITGYDIGEAETISNCNNWTSTDGVSYSGTVASIGLAADPTPYDNFTVNSIVWNIAYQQCGALNHVWCIANP